MTTFQLGKQPFSIKDRLSLANKSSKIIGQGLDQSDSSCSELSENSDDNCTGEI